MKESDNIAMDMQVLPIGPQREGAAKKERIGDFLWTKPDAHAAYIAALAGFAARGGVVTRKELDGTVTYHHPVTRKRIPATEIVNVNGFARHK